MVLLKYCFLFGFLLSFFYISVLIYLLSEQIYNRCALCKRWNSHSRGINNFFSDMKLCYTLTLP